MRRALFIAIVLLAGCARSEDASVTVDMNRIAPDIALRNSAEEEITAGAWRETVQDNSPALEFADVSSTALFSLRCAEGGGLLLQRHGAGQPGGSATIAMSVGRERRELQATPVEGGLLRATLTGGDPLVAALSGAATPIGLRAGNAPPLLLPPGPPVSAFVSRCATTQAPAAATPANSTAATSAAPAAANAAAAATNGTAAR
jgi:hypothetical protein